MQVRVLFLKQNCMTFEVLKNALCDVYNALVSLVWIFLKSPSNKLYLRLWPTLLPFTHYPIIEGYNIHNIYNIIKRTV